MNVIAMDYVIELALRAGEEILRIYNTDFDVEHKADESPLTAADRAAHQVIVDGLTAMTPDIPVLSEESEQPDFATRQSWKRYWLVDPLDGTKEFVKKNGEFTVNIALIEDHKPVQAVVGVPVMEKVYWADRNMGAFLRLNNGEERRIQTRKAADPMTAVVSRSHRGERIDALLERLPGADTVSKGSSLKFCLVAEGEADLYPRFGPTSEWDTGAAQCVVECAGGKVVKADLTPLTYNTKASILNPDFLVIGDPDVDWASLLEGIEGEER